MVADPLSLCVLLWASANGWLLCASLGARIILYGKRIAPWVSARSFFALMIRVDKDLYLVGVSFLKARPTGCSRKIAFADGMFCKAVESVNKTQHVGHKDVGYGKGPGQPFSLSEHVFHVLEASIEEFRPASQTAYWCCRCPKTSSATRAGSHFNGTKDGRRGGVPTVREIFNQPRATLPTNKAARAEIPD
jgi:hypothetical protein